MRKDLKPTKHIGGTIYVPGDKSMAHRAALLSILSKGPITVINFPDSDDCRVSLEAARTLGVNICVDDGQLVLSPPQKVTVTTDTIIECGNSATTARLLSGILAGLETTVTLAGDASLSQRPMDRIIEPLTRMGAEFFAENSCLPLKISGKKLLPFDYDIPVPSAQVKSALLMAGMASGCPVTIREDWITRDHTERMIKQLGGKLDVREIKPVLVPDPVDPRKKRVKMPEDFKKEIKLPSAVSLAGGVIDIPGDVSTAAFFMVAAAIAKKSLTITNVGVNPTRTGFIEYLRQVGCSVDIDDREMISGEPRGTITVTGKEMKPRKIYGEQTVALIDELPLVAVLAAFTDGTTVIRDASELKIKESDRLESVAYNLKQMGVKCGILDDGLAIEGGGGELPGADFKSFGDHRIVMAFSIASLFLVGPSNIDDASAVNVSCPDFYEILQQVTG